MLLRVQYTGQLRTAAGRAEEELDVPDSTSLLALLRELATRLGDSAAPHLLTSSGAVPGGLLIILNNSAIPATHTAATMLFPGDTITLLPPIAGG
jgi:molybdopterin converting factor small subunit